MGRSDSEVVLGDQSPSMGGLLRAHVLAEATGIRATYFVQDVDAPWIQKGTPKISIDGGKWPTYWSSAVRIPYTPHTPGAEHDVMRQSMKTPYGLLYLVGPTGGISFVSERRNRTLAEKSTEMLLSEVEWARRVAEMLGKPDAIARAEEIERSLRKPNNVYESSSILLDQQGTPGNISGLVQLFKEDPVRLATKLPANYYWLVTGEGYRTEYDGHLPAGAMLVPKGKALPLELAAKGLTLGYTNLGYLEKIRELRDQFVPDLPISLLQIQFDWDLDGENPLDLLAALYKEKRASGGKDSYVDPEMLARAKEYWRGRPTSISWLILGGNLNPTFTPSVL